MSFADLYREGFDLMQAPPVNPSDWQGWVWPLPIYIDGRKPEISDDYSEFKTPNHRRHLGVDMMYRRKDGDPWKFPDREGPYVMPRHWPAIAAGPGKIWAAGRNKGGLSVLIDHGVVGSAGGVLTWYQHLSSFTGNWQKGDRIQAGMPLGIVGDNPSQPDDPRHLHFELRFPREGVPQIEWRKDPAPYMKHWTKVRLGVIGGKVETSSILDTVKPSPLADDSFLRGLGLLGGAIAIAYGLKQVDHGK